MTKRELLFCTSCARNIISILVLSCLLFSCRQDPRKIKASGIDSLKGHRFFTLNTVVRVNQIEATRDQNLGQDEAAIHTLEKAKAFREAIATGWAEARITWAFSWQALFSEKDNYKQIREYARQCYEKYGDEVTFIPGGYFANAYNSREQVNKDIHEALLRITQFMGNGYRPQSIITCY